MPKKTIRQALNEALRQEMTRDPSVFVIGEDVAGGAGCEGERDCWGGALGVTKGLIGLFGPNRVIDTPITESAIAGAAAGAALVGMRPVAEIMFTDFLGVCFDPIFNQAAKFRYMFGGQANTPMVIRSMIGAGMGAGAQHSQTLHPVFTAVPGLKVAMPATAYDAKGLLIEAIRGKDPVMFLEHKGMYEVADDVPDEPYTIPFGEANIMREGDDVTLVAFSLMAHRSALAADNLEKAGISVEVIDPRTTSPLDIDTIFESVERTGRLIIVDESPPRCSLASDIGALVAQERFDALKGPIRMVTCPHTPVPFASSLETEYLPSVERIEAEVRKFVGATK